MRYINLHLRTYLRTYYLFVNFSLPRLLFSRVIPDVRYRRQTKASLNASALTGRGTINNQ